MLRIIYNIANIFWLIIYPEFMPNQAKPRLRLSINANQG